jgi:nucleoside-diphosphate-sugar epimerase
MLEQGFQVRALVRNPAKAAHLATLGISLIAGDLDNTTALEKLVTGSDVVIHGAGAVRGNSQAAFDRVNVHGTTRLLQALTAQPSPPRLLLLSSIVAREPQLSWYAHSKRAGEIQLERQQTLDWTILRPPAVYGPGDKEMLPLFQMMHRGIALIPGSPEARTSVIHVSDLAAAIIACLHSDQVKHKTLFLCDGTPTGYSWREIAAIAATLWSRPVRLWQIPQGLLNWVATANCATADITGRAPMLTPPKVRELRHPDWVADNIAITAATGWQPLVSLQQGLKQLKFKAL